MRENVLDSIYIEASQDRRPSRAKTFHMRHMPKVFRRKIELKETPGCCSSRPQTLQL
jgi:hypothetical protein